MSRAIDYAYGWRPDLTDVFKRHGVEVVLRYVGQPRNPKCLTSGELESLHAAGLALGFIYETSAQWMLGGTDAGTAAAQAAMRHVRQIGGPSEPFVWLASDWDVQEAQLPRVLACLRGAATVLGVRHVGIYGGLLICRAALNHGAAAKAWQTTAWSHGTWEPRAVLHQLLGAQWGTLGLNYDADEMHAPNVGQWPIPTWSTPHHELIDVPITVYNHLALWAARWGSRPAWQVTAGEARRPHTVRLSVPIEVYNHRLLWARSWRLRHAWEV